MTTGKIETLPNTLVITWTLLPNTRLSVSLDDVWERTVAHIEGLLAWLEVPELTNIIIAKNCRQLIDDKVLLDLAEEHHKQLEFLQATSPAEVVTRGKGYGEGSLLGYALRHSDLLRATNSFYKVTGKLFSPGYSELFQSSAGATFYRVPRSAGPMTLLPRWFFSISFAVNLLHLLRCRLKLPWNAVAYSHSRQLDTRIYWTRREFYEIHLAQSYRRVSEPLAYNLEDVLYQDAEAKDDVFYFDKHPIILGRSGTLGTTAAPFSPQTTQRALAISEALLRYPHR